MKTHTFWTNEKEDVLAGIALEHDIGRFTHAFTREDISGFTLEEAGKRLGLQMSIIHGEILESINKKIEEFQLIIQAEDTLAASKKFLDFHESDDDEDDDDDDGISSLFAEDHLTEEESDE